MALMVLNAINELELEVESAGSTYDYNDDAAISEWARAAVYEIRDYALMIGREGNIFDPRGFATRAECVTVMYRLANVVDAL